MIAVMSYNRGILLKNCLDSIERHAPNVTARIYDDGSDDEGTVEFLRRVSRAHEVIINGWRSASSSCQASGPVDRKCGGLYANMNCAYDRAIRDGFQYLLFIQEDMQMVGPFDEAFYDEHSRIWESDSRIAQIRCTFMRNPVVAPSHAPRKWLPMSKGEFFSQTPIPHGIADTGVIHLGRLRAVNWRYETGERMNIQKAQKLGIMSVFPRVPLVPQLPWSPTSSDRLTVGKGVINGICDWLYNVGVHPYADLEGAELKRLRMTPRGRHPYGERFLRIKSGIRLPEPWFYENSYAYPKLLAKAIIRRFRSRLRRSLGNIGC